MQKSSVRKEERSQPAYPIASVDNALRLLLIFRERPHVRLSDASEYLQVAHSTAHRLLAMLTYHDFVRQESGQRTYVPGPALVEIGLAAVRHMDVRSQARPVLEELAATSHETVHLAQLEGENVRYLDAVESPQALRVASRTGNVLPASCTASGKALLAELAPDEIRRMFPARQALASTTSRSITRRSQLEAELARVRAHGCAVNDEESEEGVASVAAVVRKGEQGVVGAISVSLPVTRLTDVRRQQLTEQVCAAAIRLSDVLSGAIHWSA